MDKSKYMYSYVCIATSFISSWGRVAKEQNERTGPKKSVTWPTVFNEITHFQAPSSNRPGRISLVHMRCSDPHSFQPKSSVPSFQITNCCLEATSRSSTIFIWSSMTIQIDIFCTRCRFSLYRFIRQMNSATNNNCHHSIHLGVKRQATKGGEPHLAQTPDAPKTYSQNSLLWFHRKRSWIQAEDLDSWPVVGASRGWTIG